MPELSVLSEMDPDIFDYLRGPLDLDVKFDLEEKADEGIESKI
jgi:hypothetical protein